MIATNVFGAKLVGWAMKISAEVLNPMKAGANRCLGEVAAPQLLKHDLA